MPSSRCKGLKKEIIRQLLSANTAMHYQEITSRLEAEGYAPQGQTPQLTVNSILTRGREFERVARGKYGLKPTELESPTKTREDRPTKEAN